MLVKQIQWKEEEYPETLQSFGRCSDAQKIFQNLHVMILHPLLRNAMISILK